MFRGIVPNFARLAALLKKNYQKSTTNIWNTHRRECRVHECAKECVHVATSSWPAKRNKTHHTWNGCMCHKSRVGNSTIARRCHRYPIGHWSRSMTDTEKVTTKHSESVSQLYGPSNFCATTWKKSGLQSEKTATPWSGYYMQLQTWIKSLVIVLASPSMKLT